MKAIAFQAAQIFFYTPFSTNLLSKTRDFITKKKAIAFAPFIGIIIYLIEESVRERDLDLKSFKLMGPNITEFTSV